MRAPMSVQTPSRIQPYLPPPVQTWVSQLIGTLPTPSKHRDRIGHLKTHSLVHPTPNCRIRRPLVCIRRDELNCQAHPQSSGRRKITPTGSDFPVAVQPCQRTTTANLASTKAMSLHHVPGQLLAVSGTTNEQSCTAILASQEGKTATTNTQSHQSRPSFPAA